MKQAKTKSTKKISKRTAALIRVHQQMQLTAKEVFSMKTLKAIIILMIVGISTASCTKQQLAKEWGGTVEETLPPGQKIICITWEQENLWYVTRPAHPGEQPETITMHESSSFGMYQGTIIVHEQ